MERKELIERGAAKARRRSILWDRGYKETYKDWIIGDLLVTAPQYTSMGLGKPRVYLGSQLKHIKCYDWEQQRHVCSSEGKNARKRRRFRVYWKGSFRDLKKDDVLRLVRLNDRNNEEEK